MFGDFVPMNLFVFCGEEESINQDKIPEVLRPVIALFEEDNDHNPLCLLKIHMGRLFIEGNDEQELMLRLNGPYLTVARISFRHRHQGYMTRLEQILMNICQNHPEKKGIRIESIETEEMLRYCQKNNYKQVPYCETDYVKEKDEV